jgi:hypothetical protein
MVYEPMRESNEDNEDQGGDAGRTEPHMPPVTTPTC